MASLQPSKQRSRAPFPPIDRILGGVFVRAKAPSKAEDASRESLARRDDSICGSRQRGKLTREIDERTRRELAAILRNALCRRRVTLYSSARIRFRPKFYTAPITNVRTNVHVDATRRRHVSGAIALPHKHGHAIHTADRRSDARDNARAASVPRRFYDSAFVRRVCLRAERQRARINGFHGIERGGTREDDATMKRLIKR